MKDQSPHYAYSGGRPITYNIDTMGAVLLRDAGAGQAAGIARYIDENEHILRKADVFSLYLFVAEIQQTGFGGSGGLDQPPV